MLSKTEQGVEVCRREYKKVLVINQHQFYTGERSEVVEEEGRGFVGYQVAFGVKGEWPVAGEWSLGWVNLAGSRAYLAAEGESNSLQEEEQFLRIEGYANV